MSLDFDHKYIVHHSVNEFDSRGGNEMNFTLARLASESKFTLASRDLHSQGSSKGDLPTRLKRAPSILMRFLFAERVYMVKCLSQISLKTSL